MANMLLDLFRGGEGQTPAEIDPQQDPAGYKLLLGERAANRRQQRRQQAGPNASMQALGNEGISQWWDPMSEGLRAAGEQANAQGKNFRVNTSGLGNVDRSMISDNPEWWLQGMTNATPGQDVSGILKNLPMMPASLRRLYAKQQFGALQPQGRR